MIPPAEYSDRTDFLPMRNDAELITVARQANAVFVIPGGIDRLLLPISETTRAVKSPYCEIGAAFSTNIRSVIFTAGLPYMFALEASHRRRYQLFECAGELEAVLHSETVDEGTKSNRDQVQADAGRRMRELSESAGGRASLNHEACIVLLRSCDSAEMHEAALQLVLQASVLTWGALEVVARDVFRAYLNLNPDAYSRLASDVDAKKRFELTKLPMQRMADFGFDLSNKLGELLAEQNDLSDLGTIKAAVFALFQTNTRLRAALDARELWILFQQRHLIVHRRGLVDTRYLESTGDQRNVGEKLILTPRELTRHVAAVVEAAAALLSAATSAYESGTGNRG